MNRVKEYQEMIETALSEIELPEVPKSLYDPIRYFLSLGGKRMRPTLSLLCTSLFRAVDENDAKMASSIELFHNFTLLHDDIMDEAPLRRGKETVHEKWDPNIAILSGDALMVKAYQQLAGTEVNLKQILDMFNRTSLEVCEGQQMDMDLEGKADSTKVEYLEMIRLKTAVLLGYSCWLGGKVGGADASSCKKLYEIGINAGIAFQLMDDYLDAFGDPESFGKVPGGDIRSGKKTILWFLANEEASAAKKELLASIYQQNSRDTEEVENVIDLFKELNLEEKIQGMIDQRFEKVKELVGSISAGEGAKDELLSYFRKLGKRKS